MEKNENEKIKEWVRYTNMAFEMLATIALFTFIGYQIDKWVETSKPWFTFVCCFVSVILAIYLSIKNLLKKK